MKNCTYALMFGLVVVLVLMAWRPTIAAVPVQSNDSGVKIAKPIKGKQKQTAQAITDKKGENADQKKMTDQEILRKKHKKLTFNETIELLRLRR